MNFDDYPLPEAFKKAWRKEFGRQDSVEYLANLIEWIRSPTLASFDGEEPDPSEEAKLEFIRWVKKAIASLNPRPKFRLLLRAVENATGEQQLPTREKNRAVGLRIYFELVRSGRPRITKRLWWKRVKKWYEQRGLPPPKNRARLLREIGLTDMAQARSRRRKRPKLVTTS